MVVAQTAEDLIAEQIVDAKADYVLALKGNQDSLHEAVIATNREASSRARQEPVREFTWMPRVAFRASRAADRRWALLPSAAVSYLLLAALVPV